MGRAAGCTVIYSLYRFTDIFHIAAAIFTYSLIICFCYLNQPVVFFRDQAICTSTYPFTAPSIIPFSKYFCRNGYSMRIGINAIKAMAIRTEIDGILPALPTLDAPL